MRVTMEKVLRLRKVSVKKIHISRFRGRRWRNVSGNLSEWTDTKSKGKERYPQWLESQEERRAKIEETKRNREILSNAPPEQELAEKEPEEAEISQDVKYEYHLGDKVYIGASEYEILSVDDERVMLYDL